MTERRVPGPVEKATRAELRSLRVPVESSTRAALAVSLARRLDDPDYRAVAATAGRLDLLMDRIRSLRSPAPEVGGEQPAGPAPVDAVGKARAAREARRAGA